MQLGATSPLGPPDKWPRHPGGGTLLVLRDVVLVPDVSLLRGLDRLHPCPCSGCPAGDSCQQTSPRHYWGFLAADFFTALRAAR
jgi:hypothetical protein